jgi:hypothetical protein
MNVTLEDNGTHLYDDFLVLNTPSMEWPGYPIVESDHFNIENSTLEMNPGETRLLNMSFKRGPNGFCQISYVLSKTPLNVTVNPVTFLVNRANNPYPGVMWVHADKNLPPGTYLFYLKIVGGEGQYLYPSGGAIPMDDSMYDPKLSSVVKFTVNVIAPESQTNFTSNYQE